MAKILVVDDDLTVQVVLKNLLTSQGHDVVIAHNGEEALHQVQLLHPDLMICDWIMPLIDGLEVCRQVKADPELATTFIILLTMRDQITDRVQGLDAGADEFISKPIDVEELLARVRAGLRSRQLTQQLSQALRQLQQTQAQLVQTEKMASLWQLVAGLAHEINNPVTFIYSNLSYVECYTQDLIELLNLYQGITPNPPSEVIDKIETIDLNFIIEDLPKVLSSMRRGTQRIHNMVLSLQEFSRQNRSGWQPVDINQELDNTLLMLHYRLQSNQPELTIKIIKNYGNLPLVEGYAYQLNQVFLNILNNAIDAIIEEPRTIPAWISLRTESVENERVSIRITNNGSHIPANVKARIFDPFFTTKPIGTGTGLGLAISYQIIVGQHKGSLQCFSEPGQDTEFRIELPTSVKAKTVST